MENLTFALRVVKPHTLDPLEGHTVVVLEDRGNARERFRFQIEPDQNTSAIAFALRRIIARRLRCFAYAVLQQSILRLSLHEYIGLDSHSLRLSIEITYSIKKPRILVERRNGDPIRSVRDEVTRSVRNHLSLRSRAQLTSDFRGVERQIVTAVRQSIDVFAAGYGIQIIDITIHVEPTPNDLSTRREQYEFERRTSRSSSSDLDIRSKLTADALEDAAVRAVHAVGSSIESPADLAFAINKMREILESKSISGVPTLTAAAQEPGAVKVAFRAVWFRYVEVFAWSELRVYASVGPEGSVAVADDIRLFTGSGNRFLGAATTRRLPSGEIIRVVPSVPGVHFEPPWIALPKLISWRCATFQMRLCEPLAQEHNLTGSVQFFLGPLVVGSLALAVTALSGASKATLDSSHGFRQLEVSPYRKIFVSHSHKDLAIVKQLERAYTALGDTYFRDTNVLRSGEKWQDAIFDRISEADIFQLCWSRAARASRHVQEEWRHALKVQRDRFIHPVYWHKPLLTPPPELADLHFAFYQLPRKTPMRREGGA